MTNWCKYMLGAVGAIRLREPQVGEPETPWALPAKEHKERHVVMLAQHTEDDILPTEWEPEAAKLGIPIGKARYIKEADELQYTLVFPPAHDYANLTRCVPAPVGPEGVYREWKPQDLPVVRVSHNGTVVQVIYRNASASGPLKFQEQPLHGTWATPYTEIPSDAEHPTWTSLGTGTELVALASRLKARLREDLQRDAELVESGEVAKAQVWSCLTAINLSVYQQAQYYLQEAGDEGGGRADTGTRSKVGDNGTAAIIRMSGSRPNIAIAMGMLKYAARKSKGGDVMERKQYTAFAQALAHALDAVTTKEDMDGFRDFQEFKKMREEPTDVSGELVREVYEAVHGTEAVGQPEGKFWKRVRSGETWNADSLYPSKSGQWFT